MALPAGLSKAFERFNRTANKVAYAAADWIGWVELIPSSSTTSQVLVRRAGHRRQLTREPGPGS